MEKKINLEEVGLFESEKIVNTPRSLEACKKEGIDPKELLYEPLETFRQESLVSEIQALYYEFFEKKRRELLEAAKKTRKNMINEQRKNRASYSSSVISEEMKASQQFMKKNEWHAKSIGKILSKETDAIKIMFERQKDHMAHLNLYEERIKNKAKSDKIKNDKKRLKDIEKSQQLAEKMKLDKKQAVEKFKNELKFRNVEELLEEQKIKEKEEIKIKSQMKMKEHLEKMEDYLMKVREEKEKKIKSKEEIEQQRHEKRQRMIQTSRVRIRAKSKEKEKKRLEILKKLEEELQIRKNYYLEKLKREEEKSNGILEAESFKLKEKFRSKSNERIKRTIQAQLTAEEIIEAKREKLIKKYEDIEKRQEENKEMIKQEMEIKKHREILKEFNKQWNLMRENKKNEYQKELILKKINEEEKRISELNKLKKSNSDFRFSLSQKEIYNKELIRGAIYEMSVTKKWNNKKVRKIIESVSNLNSIHSNFGSISIPEAPSPHST